MVEKDERPAQDPFSPAAESAPDDGESPPAVEALDAEDAPAGDEPVVKQIESIANLQSPPNVQTFGMKQNASGVPSTGAVTDWRQAQPGFEQPPDAPESGPPESPASDETAEKLAELEGSLADAKATVAELKKALSQAEDRIQSVSVTAGNVTQVAQQVQALNATVAAITEQLAGTPGYGAQKNFVCSSCQSTGTVAVPLKCTKCGGDNWMGWFP